MARLFISHSSANNAAAVALGDWLSEQGFDDVFLDVDPDRGLVPGERWQEALKAAADRCEAVLFLVSPAWLASKWCLAEFLLARSLHKHIFGLIIEPVPFERLPVEMTAEWQLCELVGEDHFRAFDVEVGAKRERIAFRQAGLDLLRRGLERAGLDARSFPWPPPGTPSARRTEACARLSRRTRLSFSAAMLRSCGGSIVSAASSREALRNSLWSSAARAPENPRSFVPGCGRGWRVMT